MSEPIQLSGTISVTERPSILPLDEINERLEKLRQQFPRSEQMGSESGSCPRPNAGEGDESPEGEQEEPEEKEDGEEPEGEGDKEDKIPAKSGEAIAHDTLTEHFKEAQAEAEKALEKERNAARKFRKNVNETGKRGQEVRDLSKEAKDAAKEIENKANVGKTKSSNLLGDATKDTSAAQKKVDAFEQAKGKLQQAGKNLEKEADALKNARKAADKAAEKLGKFGGPLGGIVKSPVKLGGALGAGVTAAEELVGIGGKLITGQPVTAGEFAKAGVKVAAAGLKGAVVGALVTTGGPIGIAASVALSSVVDAATDGFVNQLAEGAEHFVNQQFPGTTGSTLVPGH